MSTFDLEFHLATAVMINDDIIVEDSDIAEDKLEAAMRRHLDLPELPRKGFVSRLLGA